MGGVYHIGQLDCCFPNRFRMAVNVTRFSMAIKFLVPMLFLLCLQIHLDLFA